MNRIAAITLFVATVTLIAAFAVHAAWGKVVEINVPFNFTVNNTVLPAGNYTFGFDLLYPDVLIVRDQAKAIRAKGLGERGSIAPGKPHTLIFHSYGSQYFLSEVRIGSGESQIWNFLPRQGLSNRPKWRAGDR